MLIVFVKIAAMSFPCLNILTSNKLTVHWSEHPWTIFQHQISFIAKNHELPREERQSMPP
jgi:hypothetical protein